MPKEITDQENEFDADEFFDEGKAIDAQEFFNQILGINRTENEERPLLPSEYEELEKKEIERVKQDRQEQDLQFNRQYLGDSVYINTDGYGGLRITTEYGMVGDPSNTIYLDSHLVDSLLTYINTVDRYVTAMGKIKGQEAIKGKKN